MLDFQGRLLERARQPEKFFLAAADIVLADDIARAAADRRSQPRVAPAPPASGDGAAPQIAKR